MNSQLRIELSSRPNPYPEDPGAHLELWGSVALYVSSAREQTKLYATEWDLAQLVEWFLENRSNLCGNDPLTESIKLQSLPGESLAQALNRLQQREFADDEIDLAGQWHDYLLEFRRRHSLEFALPGSRMPEIILAYYQDSLELSRDDETDKWSYTVPAHDFCEHLFGQMQTLVEVWLETSGNSEAQERAEGLLAQLGKSQ